MRKCDLHIHTVPTVSDSAFTFSLDVLKGYVEKRKLDVIAITNHNVFEISNYTVIKDALPSVVVLPGIEVNLEGGHILVITNPDDAELYDFNTKCEAVSRKILQSTDRLTIDEFKSIFSDLSKYVLIPHYDKSPSLPAEVIEALSEYIYAGEVTSVKKFLYMQKLNSERLTPVIFSDFRSSVDISADQYPIRQTYLDITDVTVNKLNLTLRDKTKAALSASGGNRFFEIFDNGQMLSTKLNVMYGRRSSGKTWNIDKIASVFGDRAKYIQQFELQKSDYSDNTDSFENEQRALLQGFVSEFFRPFKNAVEDIVQISSVEKDEKDVDDYLKTLLKRSEMENIKDVFSSSKLFEEISYPIGGTSKQEQVIEAVITLLSSSQYHNIIEDYISDKILKSLLKELIEKYRAERKIIKCKELANSILVDVQDGLQLQTAMPPIPRIDLYGIAMRKQQRRKFEDIVRGITRERIIFRDNIQKFKIIVSTIPFNSAREVKAGQSISASLVGAFDHYSEPLVYLEKLVDSGIDTSKLYKLFVGVKYQLLNEHGYKVSGGEKSEFSFLQKIKDARTKDILLIDEPESSFDNLFLKNNINKFIKEISEEMPVVVSTHNNTIGGSIKPDFVLYAEKTVNNGEATYKLYSGSPVDDYLQTVDGDRIDNYMITIDSLEAGEVAYNERNGIYKVLKEERRGS